METLNIDNIINNLQPQEMDYNPQRIIIPHPMKQGFRKLGIKSKEVAKVIGVSQTALSLWLCGRDPIPAERDKQLYEIYRKVKEWQENQESNPTLRRKSIKCRK